MNVHISTLGNIPFLMKPPGSLLHHSFCIFTTLYFSTNFSPKRLIILSKKRYLPLAEDIFFSRGSRNRTHNQRFWRPLLYQLSYTPVHRHIIQVYNLPVNDWIKIFTFEKQALNPEFAGLGIILVALSYISIIICPPPNLPKSHIPMCAFDQFS